MTEPAPLQQIDRTYVRYQNGKYSYFGGCDYFRLASHPAVLQAVETGLKKFGLNVAASRLTTGNHELFSKLEKALAEFFEAENVTLVSNGYVTNLVAAQALAGNFSHGFIDEKSHPSLTDAAKFLGCPIFKFQHRDASDLKSAVNRCGRSAKIVLLTDGMFSHDGLIAPLKKYLKILRRDAIILVDDAHGAGTLGANGRGSIELEKVNRKQIVQTITLSKAFGVYGGAILGARDLREKIFGKSHLFVGSTPLPLPLANAALAAVKILKTNKSLRKRLRQNVDYIKSALRKNNFPVAETPSPIIPLIPKNDLEVKSLKGKCIAEKIFPSFIKYHGGPENGYFRFVISSEHSKMQLDSLLRVLNEI